MDDLMEVFNVGMSRDYAGALPVKAPGLNLGAGNKHIEDFLELGHEQGHDFESLAPFPWEDGSFEAVVAFHLLEHLTPQAIVSTMVQAQRVIRSGGTLTTVVPHRLGGMAFQDPDHKTFFTEDTWRILLANAYYKRAWDEPFHMTQTVNLIMGDTERTLALVTQWVKP